MGWLLVGVLTRTLRKMTPDTITISELELQAFIGVPETERAEAQRLTVTLDLTLAVPCESMKDNLTRTVDYFAVSRRARAVARAKPRLLIETLAADLAAMILAEFAVASVSVFLKKYILPDTGYVSIRIDRQRA